MNFHPGQIVKTITDNTTSTGPHTPIGSFAIVNEVGRYLNVKFIHARKTGSACDGGYYPEDFTPATREEIQDLHNLAEVQFEALRDALLAMPKFAVGDLVFSTIQSHTRLPYLILAIEAGHAFTWRPASQTHESLPVSALVPKPSCLEAWKDGATTSVLEHYDEQALILAR